MDHSYVIEEWYESIKELTMESIFIPMDEQHLSVIVTIFDVVYDRYFKELNYLSKKAVDNSFIDSKSNWIFDSSVANGLKGENLASSFQELLNKIDNKLSKGKEYFAKLSLRSPKDSLAIRKYKEELCQTNPELADESGDLERLALKICSGEKILEMISSSQRIKDDIKRWRLKKNYEVNLIVREWKTIPSCLEFRVFLNNNKVTAISSYYKSERHAWMIKYKNMLSQRIEELFKEKIIGTIIYCQGVFDIGLNLPQKLLYKPEEIEEHIKSNMFELMIIEVNPFSKETGAALFSWEIDKEVLHFGPLEIRLSGEDDFK